MTLLALDAINEPTVLVAIVTTVGAIALALIGLFVDWAKRKLDLIHDHAYASREQVQNSHTTNLREDMDRMHNDIRAVLIATDRNAEAIQAVAEDLRIERRERMAVAHRVDHALLPKLTDQGDDNAA